MMQSVRNFWNALPWYYQAPIAFVIGPPLMVTVVCGAILAIVPMMCWVLMDDLINPRKHPNGKGRSL